MPTRRTFLHTALIAATVPFGFRPAGALATPRIRVVIDTACNDAQALIATCHADTVAHDAAACMAAVGGELERGTLDALIGLTRDSHRFVLAQLAARHGYGQCYQGSHVYDHPYLSHALAGETGLIARLAPALAAARVNWAGVILDALPAIAAAPGLHRSTLVRVPLPPGTRPARHLVSFSLRRPAAA